MISDKELVEHCGTERWIASGSLGFTGYLDGPKFDPENDASDDNAVLEWALSQDDDTQRRFRKAIAHEGYFKWDYKVGDNARAVLKMITQGENHITTGDVRLDLGWTQEECDAEDNK